MLMILKEKKLVGEKLLLITIVSYTELRFLEYLRGFEDDVPGLCETYLEYVGSGSSTVLLDAGNVKKRVMKKVMVGKDGKPLMVARRVQFDANTPGVNEHGDLIGNDGNTRKDDDLNKNESVIHVSGHNKCTYGNENPITFVTSLSAAANTNKEDTHGAANHATKEPGVFGNSLNVDANNNNNNNMRDKSTCVQNDIHGTKEGTHATNAVGTGMKQSFASIFKTQSVSKAVRLTTMTSEFVQGANVDIPLAAVEEVSQWFKNTLYGYFIGKRLAFPLVETYVKNAWAKFGLERTMLTNGFFFFQFATPEGIGFSRMGRG
ncbi:hypothetical protein Tco_0413393 [Tanacetum coccineum]